MSQMNHDLCSLFQALRKARKSGEDAKEKVRVSPVFLFFLVCTFSILRTRLSRSLGHAMSHESTDWISGFFMKSFNLCLPRGEGGGGGCGWFMKS